ncbi:ricin-type beta-trefoil lectin domain protein [Kutzneria sp. 744]|uniref:ricin-type beta-trefoil lectin domain protein n=1 Tax=Kutzneria sp. (strain 744) TaxID=345341 RepID=UPI0003EEB8D1|nr:ricin-type beta-trefoil lectin domain protein [Kutzneria sp. 744]EWM10098.1 alpha-N-arabinofuranosidase [Kutzneria sp. 744]
MRLPLPRRSAKAAILAAALAACLIAAPGAHAAPAAPQLHVSGNHLVDSSGGRVVLHGMDRSGAEFACVQGKGIFDGPNDQASVNAIKSWGAAVNAVRVPLNEACWNGESYVSSAYAGVNYINAIKAYVNLLNSNGLVAILDLHWTDGTYTGNSASCSSAQATCQKPMPDAAQAIPFWTSVASTFKGDNAVVFDLFNEPYASRATGNTTSGWQCWKNGGTCNGIGYQVAGMQGMVNAVRATDASNVLMLGGEEYSNDLTQWLAYEPTDPDHNLVASWHSYNFNACANQSCWNSQIAPVIAKVPLVAGEIGESDCAGAYINPLMSWLDSQHTSYLAWTWNNWSGSCSSGPTLITDYNGTPTNYGAAYKAHLASLGGGPGGGTSGPLHAVGAGKCLDVPNQSTTAGTQLDIRDCNGGTNQQWTHTSSGRLTVYSGSGQMCLDANNSQTTAGTKAVIRPCGGGANQQWNVNANGSVTGVQSGLCLDVTGASTANGALVELWTCNGGSNQRWTLG